MKEHRNTRRKLKAWKRNMKQDVRDKIIEEEGERHESMVRKG